MASATVEQALATLDGLLQGIQAERDRLADERETLLAAKLGVCVLIPPLCFLDVGELQSRADTLATMIASLEEGVERVVNVARKFEETGDPTLLSRALEAADNILGVADSTGALDELSRDAQSLLSGILADLRKVPQLAPRIGFGIGAALAGLAALLLALRG